MNDPIICAICGKSKPTDTFTVRQKWMNEGGYGSIPDAALVHPACDKKEQRQSPKRPPRPAT